MKRDHKPFLPLSWKDVPLILSLKDAAQIVGLTQERLAQLAKSENEEYRFPAGKVGGTWRVEKHALIEYLIHRGVISNNPINTAPLYKKESV